MEKDEFGKALEEYLNYKRDEMLNNYNRVLPTGELLFNRFDKNEYLKGGKGSSVYDTSVIMGDVEIGDHVWVGPYTLLEGINGKLKVGHYVSIDAGVMVYTHDSTKHHVSGGIEPFITGDVSIGNYSVIGSMSIIGCNVSIGEHCVVAANSYVNMDIPDCSIVAGNPAKVIGRVIISDDGHVDFIYD